MKLTICLLLFTLFLSVNSQTQTIYDKSWKTDSGSICLLLTKQNNYLTIDFETIPLPRAKLKLKKNKLKFIENYGFLLPRTREVYTIKKLTDDTLILDNKDTSISHNCLGQEVASRGPYIFIRSDTQCCILKGEARIEEDD